MGQSLLHVRKTRRLLFSNWCLWLVVPIKTYPLCVVNHYSGDTLEAALETKRTRQLFLGVMHECGQMSLDKLLLYSLERLGHLGFTLGYFGTCYQHSLSSPSIPYIFSCVKHVGIVELYQSGQSGFDATKTLNSQGINPTKVYILLMPPVHHRETWGMEGSGFLESPKDLGWKKIYLDTCFTVTRGRKKECGN